MPLLRVLVLTLCFALSVIGGFSTRVCAHAPPEVWRAVWKNESELVLVTNRGLMFGNSTQRSFRLMCNEALHVTNTEQPSIAYRRDGALLAATSEGLFLTEDEGCTWAKVPPLSNMFVPALAQLPGDPDTLFAATFGTGQSALRVSHDGGRNWSVLSALADRDYTRVLMVAGQDPMLLYTTGTVLVDLPTPHSVHYAARSSNAGQSWERSDIQLQEGELSLLLLAINPAQTSELLARASSASPGFVSERLMLSRDGGKTFSPVFSLLSITGATFSADGKDVWVVGNEGIFHAGPERADFQRVGSAQHLTCVDYQQGELWTCGNFDATDPRLDGVGRAADPTHAMFEKFMTFVDVTEPVSCSELAPTLSTCRVPWNDFHSEVFRTSDGDAGLALDAGAVDAASSPLDAEVMIPSEDGEEDRSDAQWTRPGRKRSGCAVLSWGQPRSGVGATLLTLSVLLARRRRRSR